MKNYIKENAKEIIENLQLLKELQNEGYQLQAINRNYNQGVALRNRRNDDFIVYINNEHKSETENKKAIEFLSLLFNDKKMFDCLESVKVNYCDARWDIDRIVQDYDFINYRDQIVERYTIKLNPITERISTTKPKLHYYSVLVALNID